MSPDPAGPRIITIPAIKTIISQALLRLFLFLQMNKDIAKQEVVRLQAALCDASRKYRDAFMFLKSTGTSNKKAVQMEKEAKEELRIAGNILKGAKARVQWFLKLEEKKGKVIN